jgi:hypothetical protein
LGPPGAVLILIITAALTVSLLGLFFKATRHVTSTVLGSLSWALVSASAVGFFLATIARRFLLATIARRLLLATISWGLLLTGSVARGLWLLVPALFTVAALGAAALALLPAMLLVAVPGTGSGFAPLVLAARTCTTPVSIVGAWATITTTVSLMLLLLLFLTLLTLFLRALLVRILAIVRVIVVVVIGMFLVW